MNSPVLLVRGWRCSLNRDLSQNLCEVRQEVEIRVSMFCTGFKHGCYSTTFFRVFSKLPG
jgi:hypothetical protein